MSKVFGHFSNTGENFFVNLGKVLTITSKVLFKVYFKKAFYIPENSNVQNDFSNFSYNIVKTHLPIRISKLTPNHF